MRALCTGDLHFGAGARFADDRLGEQEQLWETTLETAAHQAGGLVLVAGDVWHRPRPTPAEYLAFARPLRKFSQVVNVHVCPGNHDWLAADQPTGLEVLRELPNLTVHSKPEVMTRMSLVQGEGLIGWLPWTPPHRIVAANPGASRDEVNALVAETLVQAARGLREQGAEVLVAHWAVSNAKLPGGELVQEFLREPVLPIHELQSIGFKAIVLGHIHRFQFPNPANGPAFYVGSPMPLDFGEGGYEHGVVLLETDETAQDYGEWARTTFVPLESRPFLTIDHRESPGAAAALAFAATYGVDFQLEHNAGAIVRLRYRATREEQAKIDTAALVRQLELAGASRVFVLPEIVKSVRARVVVDDDLGPVEAVQTWADAQGYVDSDGVPALLDLTNELLGEVGAA